mmetsp:Transcript_36349/g.79135  ORF Transcript_36349/g.79135 Transcript_36349/m.79135 type:complete len:1145 (+) Transcript_36349:145-3579(+)
MSASRSGKKSGAYDIKKPLIKSFHSWEVQWDSGGISSMGKAARAVLNPTTPIKWYDRRLITCEIHRIPPTKRGGLEAEKAVVRVMVPTKQGKFSTAKHDGSSSSDDDDSDASSSDDGDDGGDDNTISTYGSDGQATKYHHMDSIGPVGGFVAGRVDGFNRPESYGGGSSTIPLPTMWKTRKQLSLQKIRVVNQFDDKVFIAVGMGHSIKKLKFASEQDAKGFAALIAHLRAGQSQRMKQRKVAAINSLVIQDEDVTVEILVEIVSAWGLMAVDLNGKSDPYVRASFEGKELHRTKDISNTLEPIYTVKTGSLFLFSTTLRKLFDAREGLKFTVKDYDTVGKNETLGVAVIPPRTLYDANGERMVLPLAPEVGEKFAKGGNGFIAIRCRKATEHDRQFMRKLNYGGIDNVGNASPTAALESKGKMNAFKSLVTLDTKMIADPTGKDIKATIKKHRVRPYPDPERRAETKWMTSAELQEHAFRRSTNWIDAGSGSIGRIYLEIIGCDGLPNLDRVAGMISNVKTDTFVTVVYEDCVLKTDVVGNCLSPRWMPWCKRAFSLRQMHSSSQLFLGIFDYNATGQNDRVGRVVVDLSAYRPNTEYLLHFNIFNTQRMTKRKPRGTITIRVLMELENERELVTSALSFPAGHAYFVNVPQRKDFFDVRYTSSGKHGAEEYGMKQIDKYLDEIYMTRRILFYAYHLSISVVFWRGHAPLTICVPRLCPFKDIEELGGRRCTRSVTIYLPIRSLVVFIAAVHLVENPDDIPSFMFGAIAFVMLSSLHFRRSSPNKLIRGQPYYYYLCLLLFGKGCVAPHNIEPYENAEEYEALKARIEEKAATFEKEAEEARLENLKKQQEHQKEMEEIGLGSDLDISTQGASGIASSVSFSPLKALYVQIQTILELVVIIIRFSHNILVWEEACLAFWLTSAALVLSFVCIFIPWGKVIEWACRFCVWTFLGPWMKLVDVFWHSHFKRWLHQLQQYQEKQQKEALDLAKMEARTTNEDVHKLKAMKTAIFGNYISRVPVYDCERYKDVPLPASEAHPLLPSDMEKEKAKWNIVRVHGQRLTGDLIPVIEDPVDSEAHDVLTSQAGDADRIRTDEDGGNDVPVAGENKPLLDKPRQEEKHHWLLTRKNLLHRARDVEQIREET